MVNGNLLYLAIDTAAKHPPRSGELHRTPETSLELFQFTDRWDAPALRGGGPADVSRSNDSIEFGGFRRVRIRVGGGDHAVRLIIGWSFTRIDHSTVLSALTSSNRAWRY